MEPLFMIEQIKRAGAFSMDSDHYHDSYEIYYLLAGERNYYINNLVYALRSGDLIFINRNELHRTVAKGTSRHERILINFRHDFVNRLMEQLQLELPFSVDNACCCALMRMNRDDREPSLRHAGGTEGGAGAAHPLYADPAVAAAHRDEPDPGAGSGQHRSGEQ